MKIFTYPVGFKMTCHFQLSKAMNCKMTQGKGMIIISKVYRKKAGEAERKEVPFF